MITTRRDVIISRLPNRLEPKTTASATGEKPIPSNMRSAKASHRKLKSSMTVRETGWWCGYWQPNGDQGFSHTSARHQSCTKTWKHSQSLSLSEFEWSKKKKQNHRQSIILQQLSQQSTSFRCLKNIKMTAKSLVVNVSRIPTVVGEDEWKIFV